MYKSLLTGFLAVFLFSSLSMAFEPMDAQLRCVVDRDNQELAFNHSDKKVWLTETGYAEGQPLEVIKYEKTRRLGGYSVEAQLLGGVYKIQLYANGPDISVLEMSVTGENSRGEVVTDEVSGECVTAVAEQARKILFDSNDGRKQYVINLPNSEDPDSTLEVHMMVSDSIYITSSTYIGELDCEETNEKLSCSGEAKDEVLICSDSKKSLLDPEAELCSSIAIVPAKMKIQVVVNKDSGEAGSFAISFEADGVEIKDFNSSQLEDVYVGPAQ